MIPEIGTQLKLSQDWTFSLFWESRNEALIQLLIDKEVWDNKNIVATTEECQGCFGWHAGQNKKVVDIWQKYFEPKYPINRLGARDYHKPSYPMGAPVCYQMTWPKDTILTVDRIYIRKGGEQFSSITFRTASTTITQLKKKKPRFWAKLYEVNTIECEPA